jgi:hypothetical protein
LFKKPAVQGSRAQWPHASRPEAGRVSDWAFSKDAAANEEREKIINELY